MAITDVDRLAIRHFFRSWTCRYPGAVVCFFLGWADLISSVSPFEGLGLPPQTFVLAKDKNRGNARKSLCRRRRYKKQKKMTEVTKE